MIAIAVPRVDWIAGALVAVGAATAVPLTGHGAAHGAWLWWTHAAHVFGGSLWLGTLAVLRTRDVDALAAGFTSTAGASCPAGSIHACGDDRRGDRAALGHRAHRRAPRERVGVPLEQLGRTLLVKLTVVFGLAAIGWLNWRSSRSPTDNPRARRALQSRAIIEAATALLVVLAITAILAGLSPTQ